jgi:Ca2+-binding RTX toxin-like protein
LAGLDKLFGDDGWNKLCGGLGDDELNCHRGKDKIIGKAGFDTIIWL